MRLRVSGAQPREASGRPTRGHRRIAAAGLAVAWAVLGCAVAPEARAAERGLVTVIDNSGADSILEIDRTADLLVGRGSAGSDHDGATTLVTGLLGAAPAPVEAEEGEE
ncbi:hypothetical protein ACFCX4_12830 [Kitasatospora sp. NPDC056327]|uniref:hypothetical protein n=1 Tax=Kitasatospora sp. NPDC056327 TaxID=3345785 RepID=UPI0035D7EC51